MLQHKATNIRFILNQDCALFADLIIEPKPDHLLRFYMVWNPINSSKIAEQASIKIPAQNRTGFTVLEWGGMEISRENQLVNR